MAGLGAFLLAGFLGGAGEALKDAAKERKARAAERAKARREQMAADEQQRRDSEIYRQIYAPTAERGRENLGETSPLWGQVNTGGRNLGFGDTVTPAEGAQAAPGDDTFVSPQQPPQRMGFGEVLNPTANAGSQAVPPGLFEAAAAAGTTPEDLLTAMLYETGGSLDPMQRGPTTQWGQHQGFIQFGEPQAREHGADFSSRDAALASQLGADGAIVRYLQASGFKPGMSFADLYSTINAGAPGLLDRTDENNGGAPGTVADKVGGADMAAYRQRAREMLASSRTSGAISLSAPPAQPGDADAARIEQLIFMATDPNASSDARAAAKKELERIGQPGAATSGTSTPGSTPAPDASKLASEIWMDNGDGTETLYGRVSGGNTLEPYLKDGKPVTRNRDDADKGGREADWQLASGQMQAIEENMDADDEADRWENPPTLTAMRLEVERLMKADSKLTLSQAYDLAANAWGGDDTTIEVPDPQRVLGVTIDGDRTRTEAAPVYAFRYDDDALKPRATDPGVVAATATTRPGPYRAAEPPIRPQRMGLGVLTGRSGDLRGLAGGTQTTSPAAPVMPTAPVPMAPAVTGPDRRVTSTPEFAQAIQSIPNEATPARDNRFIEMARAGYASPLSTTTAPVTLTEGLPEELQSIEFRVGVMPVAFGDGSTDIVMPASYNLGKSVVEQMGGYLPTRGIVDAMYSQGNRVIVQPQGASADMTSMAAAARHSKAVYSQLPGDTSKPVVGPFKEILADGHYYGLWKQNGTPRQPYTDLNGPHNYGYADYSQAARMVAPTAIVTYADGRRVEVSTLVLYNTPALRGVLGFKG